MQHGDDSLNGHSVARFAEKLYNACLQQVADETSSTTPFRIGKPVGYLSEENPTKAYAGIALGNQDAAGLVRVQCEDESVVKVPAQKLVEVYPLNTSPTLLAGLPVARQQWRIQHRLTYTARKLATLEGNDRRIRKHLAGIFGCVGQWNVILARIPLQTESHEEPRAIGPRPPIQAYAVNSTLLAFESVTQRVITKPTVATTEITICLFIQTFPCFDRPLTKSQNPCYISTHAIYNFFSMFSDERRCRRCDNPRRN